MPICGFAATSIESRLYEIWLDPATAKSRFTYFTLACKSLNPLALARPWFHGCLLRFPGSYLKQEWGQNAILFCLFFALASYNMVTRFMPIVLFFLLLFAPCVVGLQARKRISAQAQELPPPFGWPKGQLVQLLNEVWPIFWREALSSMKWMFYNMIVYMYNVYILIFFFQPHHRKYAYEPTL